MSKNKTKPPSTRIRILVILLIISMPIFLLIFNTGRVVFSARLVKEILTDEAVNSNLLPAALEWFSEWRANQRVEQGEALTGVNEPDIVLLMSFLDHHDWQKIKNEIVTEDILINWVSVIVDSAYAWIDSTDDIPQISLDMKDFKNRLKDEPGVNSLGIAYSRLPQCSDTQIADFKSRQDEAPNTEVLYNLCMFPDPWHDDQVSDYLDALEDVVYETPDLFPLANILDQSDESNQDADKNNIKPLLKFARWSTQLAWLIPYMLLLIILAFGIRSIWELGRWWGRPLLIAGLITLIIPLTYKGVISSLFSIIPSGALPKIMIQEATHTALQMAKAIFKPMLIQAAIISSLGLLFLLIGSLISSKNNDEKQIIANEQVKPDPKDSDPPSNINE